LNLALSFWQPSTPYPSLSFGFEAKTLPYVFGLAHLYLCLFSLSLAGVGFTTPERYGNGDPFPFQPSQGVGLCEILFLQMRVMRRDNQLNQSKSHQPSQGDASMPSAEQIHRR